MNFEPEKIHHEHLMKQWLSMRVKKRRAELNSISFSSLWKQSWPFWKKLSEHCTSKQNKSNEIKVRYEILKNTKASRDVNLKSWGIFLVWEKLKSPNVEGRYLWFQWPPPPTCSIHAYLNNCYIVNSATEEWDGDFMNIWLWNCWQSSSFFIYFISKHFRV